METAKAPLQAGSTDGTTKQESDPRHADAGLDWSEVPLYRRALFNAVLVLVFIPASLILMWTGPIYQKKAGRGRALPTRDKVVLSVLGIAVMGFNVTRLGPIWDDRCSAAQIQARFLDLNAGAPLALGSNRQALHSLEYQQQVVAAGSRLQATFLRGDLDTACKIVDQLEHDLRR